MNEDPCASALTALQRAGRSDARAGAVHRFCSALDDNSQSRLPRVAATPGPHVVSRPPTSTARPRRGPEREGAGRPMLVYLCTVYALAHWIA